MLPRLRRKYLNLYPSTLPNQSGKSGEFLKTDGVRASWGIATGDRSIIWI